MEFIWPVMLLSLLLIPLLVTMYLRLQQRRRQITANFDRLGLAHGNTGSLSAIKRHLPAALFLFGISILLVALARPQTVVSLPKVEGTVILAFDVSGSMAADDMKPSRIQAAKEAAKAFIDQQPLSVQIGVVAFSDSGFSVQPPTGDREAILASIDRLVPEKGTSLANGIIVSLNTIAAQNAIPAPQYYSNITPEPTPTPTPMPPGSYSSAAIVLLTDGENNENPDPLVAAQAAADRGVRIYTIGIGSPEGAVLHIDGFAIQSKLDEGLLKQISEITGGDYYNASSSEDLMGVYSHLTPQLVVKPEKTEVTSIFAGASILILLIGGILSLLWFGRLP